MMNFDFISTSRPLPPDGSVCTIKYGPRTGERVTVLDPLRIDERSKPVQVLVKYADGETWAKFAYELEEA